MEIRNFRKTNRIKLYGTEIPSPCLNIDEILKKQLIQKETFDKIHSLLPAKPTALQSQIWPIAINKRSIICVAQRQPGTLLSYILPAIISTEQNTKICGRPKALILSAEVDSCREIFATAQKLITSSGLSSIWHATDNSVLLESNILLATPKNICNLLLGKN
jgi:superfamily II DNA/RNA helicase